MKHSKNILAFLSLAAAFAILTPASSAGWSLGLGTGYHFPLQWSDTWEAIFDSAGAPYFAGEIAFDLNERFELLLSIEYLHQSGDRLWPSEDGGWQKSGQTSVEIISMDLLARMHFMRDRLISPYLAIGAGGIKFSEEDSESISGFGLIAQGGGNFRLTPSLKLFIEGNWSIYPGTIGDGGVSGFYGEKNLGGASISTGLRYHF